MPRPIAELLDAWQSAMRRCDQLRSLRDGLLVVSKDGVGLQQGTITDVEQRLAEAEAEVARLQALVIGNSADQASAPPRQDS
jgi:hypothetical protein